LVDHLFRHDTAKMVAVLTRIFGAENVDLAEDVVQDALTEAMRHWTYKGVPDNPSAWLFRVAKNKALTLLKNINDNTHRMLRITFKANGQQSRLYNIFFRNRKFLTTS
jgi:predicted RNA polymerase sigma factor